MKQLHGCRGRERLLCIFVHFAHGLLVINVYRSFVYVQNIVQRRYLFTYFCAGLANFVSHTDVDADVAATLQDNVTPTSTQHILRADCNI